MAADPIEFNIRRLVVMEDQGGHKEIPNVIAGDAKAIEAKLSRYKCPTAVYRLLSRMKITTFGDKGKHRNNGRDEHYCEFNLAKWAIDMGMARSQVIRTRDRMVEAHIITFIPHPAIPGQGIIGWNMQVDEWEAIGPKGGAHNLEGNALFQDAEYQAALHTLKAKRAEYKSSSCQTVNDDLSKCKREMDISAIKVLKPASLDASPSQAAPVPLRKTTLRKIKNPDTTVSGDAAIAVAPIIPALSDSLTAFRGACFKLLRAHYGNDLAKEGRELAAIKRMFEKKVPIEDVEGCWAATLLDPRWDADPLTMAILEEKMQTYRRGRDGYRLGMQRKRDYDNQRRQQDTKRNGHHPTQSTAPPDELAALAKAGDEDSNKDFQKAKHFLPQGS